MADGAHMANDDRAMAGDRVSTTQEMQLKAAVKEPRAPDNRWQI